MPSEFDNCEILDLIPYSLRREGHLTDNDDLIAVIKKIDDNLFHNNDVSIILKKIESTMTVAEMENILNELSCMFCLENKYFELNEFKIIPKFVYPAFLNKVIIQLLLFFYKRFVEKYKKEIEYINKLNEFAAKFPHFSDYSNFYIRNNYEFNKCIKRYENIINDICGNWIEGGKNMDLMTLFNSQSCQ